MSKPIRATLEQFCAYFYTPALACVRQGHTIRDQTSLIVASSAIDMYAAEQDHAEHVRKFARMHNAVEMFAARFDAYIHVPVNDEDRAKSAAAVSEYLKSI